MCTVSVIRWSPRASEKGETAGGYRLVSSRDEKRDRPEAEPPRRRPFVGIWPTDAAGGGTWVGAAPRGLALTLLNVNIAPNGRAEPGTSRGLLIPALLRRRSAERAIEALRAMALASFAPFRLVAAEPGEGGPRVVDARWDGLELDIHEHPAGRSFEPICFVSSGLGDEVVRPRLPLFDAMVRPAPGPATQDGFHRHTWVGRSAESVMMSRADARTVSITTVETGGAGRRPRMGYEAVNQTL